MARVLFSAYLVAIGLPIFVYPAYRITNLHLILDPNSPVWRDYQVLRIHFVVGLSALVGLFLAASWVMAWRRQQQILPPNGVWVVLLAGSFLAALLAGLLVDPGRLNVVFFIQTVVPMVGFFVGTAMAESARTLRRAFWLFATTSAVSISAILALAVRYDVYSGVIERANHLARAVPQVRDYFPFLAVAALALTVALWRSETRPLRRLVLTLLLVMQLGYYTVNWSRMGILMLLLVLLVTVALSRGLGRHRKLVLGGLAVLVVLGLTAVSAVIAERWRRGEFGHSDSRRVQYATTAIEKIAGSPVFGRMFIPDWERDPFPDRKLRVRRMYKAHNQYLDYGIRAGLPAMALLGILLWRVARDFLPMLFRTRGSPTGTLLAGIAAALAALLVGNLTQLFLVQAQTGALAWLLLGAASRAGSWAESELSYGIDKETPEASG